jgi:hypothetical protein
MRAKNLRILLKRSITIDSTRSTLRSKVLRKVLRSNSFITDVMVLSAIMTKFVMIILITSIFD